MSIRTLSNLAVQDITDESAEIHSGGLTFVGTDTDTNIGSGLRQLFSTSTPALNASVGIRFINNPGGLDLSFANNKLDKFQVNDAGNRSFRVQFFDGDNFTQQIGDFTLTGSGANTNTVFLSSFARNRTSSVIVTRSA